MQLEIIDTDFWICISGFFRAGSVHPAFASDVREMEHEEQMAGHRGDGGDRCCGFHCWRHFATRSKTLSWKQVYVGRLKTGGG